MAGPFVVRQFDVPIVDGFNLYWVDDIAISDFNGDLNPDVLISYHAQNNVTLPLRLLKGDGAGTLVDMSAQVFGQTLARVVMANQLLVADFNGDGRSDVFAIDSGHDVSPWPGRADTLLLSSGANTLIAGVTPNLAGMGHSGAVGDIDGDGDIDVYVGNIHGQADVGPYFLVNQGGGVFAVAADRLPTAVSKMAGQVYTASVLGDFNNDGKLDLFLGSIGLDAAKPHVFWNDGSGSFLQPTALPELPTDKVKTYTGAVTLDLNGDGFLDIIAGLGVDEYNGGALQVLVNTGAGGFSDQTSARILSAQPLAPAGVKGFFRPQLFDMNGDGHLDIVLNGYTNTPVLLNDGAGRFIALPASFLPRPAPPSGIITYYPYPESAPRPPPAVLVDHFRAGDFNGDGRGDLISAQGTDYATSERYVIYFAQDPGAQINGSVGDDGLIGDGDAETINGLAGADVIFGGAGADTLDGGSGDDILVGGVGADLIIGGEGLDEARYSGALANYRIAATSDGFEVTDRRSPSSDGADSLRSVEILRFADISLTLGNPQISFGIENVLRLSSTIGAGATIARDLSARISSAALTAADAISEVVKTAGATTSVATLAYQFFTGKIPGLGGIDYLVSPTGPNSNNLNSAYYQSFNLENRYINFAVNLGRDGEGRAKFLADYGALSLADATKKAYGVIFGAAPSDAKVTALLSGGRDLYFDSYGKDGLNGQGTKAAMVGWLLAEAVKADLGVYAKANDAFLADLADGASFSIDLIGVYGRPEFVFGSV